MTNPDITGDFDDDDPREETRVVVPPRGAEDEEIVIGPIALDDCDPRGSQIRHRWPGGDGESQYAEGIYPEHLDQVRATLIDLAVAFYLLGKRDGLRHEPGDLRDRVAGALAKGVETRA